MKRRIKAFLKQNKFAYSLYFYFGSLLLRLIGLFIKTDPDLILFISYGGQKYDDSPRVVYEYLLKHPVSSQHKYVWAFIDPDQFPQVDHRVKVDTIAYYVTAMRAGYWITNSSASRGLNFRKKQTKNFCFTHGLTGIKKIGIDVEQFDKAFRIGFQEQFDGIFVEGSKEIPILAHAWQMDSSVFYATGLPRNDDLATATEDEIRLVKARMGIPQSKKVILYAPTFREFSRAEDGRNALGIPIDFSKWEAALGQEYVLLVTAHYEVAKLLDELPTNDFVVNAFQYPVLNDLIKVSDILISDYSSIVFDYSIMERPIFCYGYDYDTYSVERGLYTDLEQLFSHGVLRTEDEVLKAIQEINYEQECEYTRNHIKYEYIAAYGDAASASVQLIFGRNESCKP